MTSLYCMLPGYTHAVNTYLFVYLQIFIYLFIYLLLILLQSYFFTLVNDDIFIGHLVGVPGWLKRNVRERFIHYCPDITIVARLS